MTFVVRSRSKVSHQDDVVGLAAFCAVDRGHCDTGRGIELLSSTEEGNYVGTFSVRNFIQGLVPDHISAGQKPVVFLQRRQRKEGLLLRLNFLEASLDAGAGGHEAVHGLG